MEKLKKDWLIWLMLWTPVIFIIVNWNQFPETIATHFDGSGNPNGYSSKAFGLFLIPAMNMGFYFLFMALPLIDPKKRNYILFSEKYRIIQIALHIFFTFMFFMIAFIALGYKFNSNLMIMYGVMFLFLVLGNYMGNIRPNYFIGVRTPWTLANEEVWTKTHRLTAKLWVGVTLAMMAIFPFLPDSDIIFGIYVGVISVIPIVYSFIIYKKLKIN